MNKVKFDTTELDVCMVCLHLLANGEYNDGEDTAEVCAAGQEKIWGEDLRYMTLGGEELGFSWSSCDGCGDTHGGDRYRASMMIPVTKITKLTGLQVDALKAALTGEDKYRVTVTATTAEFSMPAPRALDMVRKAQERAGQEHGRTGHPYASLHGVLRKISAQA